MLNRFDFVIKYNLTGHVDVGPTPLKLGKVARAKNLSDACKKASLLMNKTI